MVAFLLPLLLGGLGAAAAGGEYGMQLLGDLFEESDRERTGKRWSQALQDSTIMGAPGSPRQIDRNRLAETLAAQGDEAGMAALLNQAADPFALEAFRQAGRMDLEAMKQQGERAALPPGRQVGNYSIPYILPTDTAGQALIQEGERVARLAEIQQLFDRTLRAYGTEDWGQLASQLRGTRAEAISLLGALREAGAFQEADIEFYGSQIADLEGLVGDPTGQRRGALEAMRNQINSLIRNYTLRSEWGLPGAFPQVSPLMSEAQRLNESRQQLIDQGAQPVTEEQLDAEIEARRSAGDPDYSGDWMDLSP